MGVCKRKMFAISSKKGGSKKRGSSRADIASMNVSPSINCNLIDHSRVSGYSRGTIGASNPCAEQGWHIFAFELGTS